MYFVDIYENLDIFPCLIAYAQIVPSWADQLLPQLLMNLSNTSHTQCNHIKHMHEGFGVKNKFCYEKLDIFSDIGFDIFKELSDVIFSMLLKIPNVADYYLKDHLHRFY